LPGSRSTVHEVEPKGQITLDALNPFCSLADRWPFITVIMKTGGVLLMALCLCVLAGCASAPKTARVAVRVGMSREELRLHFGEPLRIESAASGGEDWYYRFAQWETYPTGETGTTEDFGDRTSYVAVGLGFSKNTQEHAIHVSSEGRVIEPLPKGKVVKND
jgi:hypothetical protein